jgi:hypothetical protein
MDYFRILADVLEYRLDLVGLALPHGVFDGALEDVAQEYGVFDLCLGHLLVLHIEDDGSGNANREYDGERSNGYDFSLDYHLNILYYFAASVTRQNDISGE